MMCESPPGTSGPYTGECVCQPGPAPEPTFRGQPMGSFSRPAFQPLASGEHGKALTVLRHIGSRGIGLSRCCEMGMYVRGHRGAS